MLERIHCNLSAVADFFSTATGLLGDTRRGTLLAVLATPFLPIFLGQLL